MDDKKHSPIAQRSADADILISEISRKQKGELVTWEYLSSLIGKNLQVNRGVMQTVKNRLLRDYGIVLSSQPGVGYVLCSDVLIVEGELGSDRKRRRKAAMRSKMKGQVVDLTKLNETQQLRCLGEIAAAHVVAESSTDKSQKKIISGLGGETKPLALNKALLALMKNGDE